MGASVSVVVESMIGPAGLSLVLHASDQSARHSRDLANEGQSRGSHNHSSQPPRPPPTPYLPLLATAPYWPAPRGTWRTHLWICPVSDVSSIIKPSIPVRLSVRRSAYLGPFSPSADSSSTPSVCPSVCQSVCPSICAVHTPLYEHIMSARI